MNLFWKKTSVFAGALLSAGTLLCAGEADERALGDKAMRAEDYPGAISFYESALTLADSGNLPEAWAENALRLGKARLFNGDIAGARKIISEFRKRNPVRSAGTLPGDLLAAEGKFAEAQKFFSVLESGADEMQSLEAKFKRGCVLCCLGEYTLALEIFDSLLTDERVKKLDFYTLLQREMVYTLIRDRQFSKAQEMISQLKKNTPSSHWEILQQLSVIHSGDLDRFKSVWRVVLNQQPPRPQHRVCELLISASALAKRRGDMPFAVQMLKKSLEYAVSDNSRMDIIKNMINIQSSCDVSGAGKSALYYADTFKEAPDRDKVLIDVAKLLSANTRYTEATDMLMRVLNNPKAAVSERLSAAASGVITAEKAKDGKAAVTFYEFLINNSLRSETAVHNMQQYADYLRRSNDLKGAQSQLFDAVKKAGAKERENLLFMLVEVSSAIGDTATVFETAAQLVNSQVPLYSACADYELGVYREKGGFHAEARSHFLRAAKAKDAEKYSVPAAFSAALMALKLNDTLTAAGEFAAFARSNPGIPEAPEALYLACSAWESAGKTAEAAQCAALLLKNYPDSTAAAQKIMQSASSRAASGDIHGAISELEEMENKFAGKSEIVSESMLMRSRFNFKRNDMENSRRAALELLKHYPSSRAAAEAALIVGDTWFTTGNFAEAEKNYLSAARVPGIPGQVARGKVIDCHIKLFTARKKDSLADTIKLCNDLINSSGILPLRLNARYKLALCYELSGNIEGAVSSCEKLLYDALNASANAIPVEPQWCVKALDLTLRLLTSGRHPRAWQRGSRIIANAEALNLPGTGIDFAALRRDFYNKISNQRR